VSARNQVDKPGDNRCHPRGDARGLYPRGNSRNRSGGRGSAAQKSGVVKGTSSDLRPPAIRYRREIQRSLFICIFADSPPP
jgi:hypothetical protein